MLFSFYIVLCLKIVNVFAYLLFTISHTSP
nr:MAG TPA: hypothetical protein [Caudoviricetes sp.]